MIETDVAPDQPQRRIMVMTQRRARSISAAVVFSILSIFAVNSLVYAQAAWKPQKNVEIIAGTSPGGGQDTSARAIQRLIQEKQLLEVPSAVVNKPGGGSSVGYAYLNQHPGDAHYLMSATTPLITNPITGLMTITYADITPLAMLFDEYIATSVAANSPIKSGKDLLAPRLRLASAYPEPVAGGISRLRLLRKLPVST